MGTQEVGLRDVSHGTPRSRARLLAPLRYLWIYHPEKIRYDFLIPGVISISIWVGYMLLDPKPKLFGDDGLLRFVRDLLIMAVPFMVGALSAVAMGSPGNHLDRRPRGAPLFLDGRPLSLRSFVCYLLGYVSFLGLLTLGLSVGATLMRGPVLIWTAGHPVLHDLIHSAGALALSGLLSFLTVAVLWSLYFLTEVVNQDS